MALGANDEAANPVIHALLNKAMASGEIQRSDLYRDDAGQPRLDFIAPLRKKHGVEQRDAIIKTR